MRSRGDRPTIAERTPPGRDGGDANGAVELTRRDALAALGALGISASTAGCGTLSGGDGNETDDESGDGGPDDLPPVVEDVGPGDLVAVAEVLYPSDVEPTEEFVETYVHGRAIVDDAYRSEVEAAYRFVDEAVIDSHGDNVAALDLEDRDEALRFVGLRTADADPDGDDVEHARHYLIDELLYPLSTLPRWSQRAGIENPKGHPGGAEAYQEASDQ